MMRFVAIAALMLSGCQRSGPSSAPPQHLLGATAAPPAALSCATLAGSLYVDPQNSSGCASDSNSGTSATCGSGGSGPVIDYRELVRRWGTVSPTFCQLTTLTWLSTQTTANDPVIFHPIVRGGGIYALLTSTCASPIAVTIGSVTAKNRATPQLLQADIGASGAANMFLSNSTHSSNAWAFRVVSGTVFAISQPLAPIATLPFTSATVVDTWANSDSVSMCSQIGADLVDVGGIFTGVSASTDVAVIVRQLATVHPLAAVSDVHFGPNAYVYESRIDKTIELDANLGLQDAYFFNDDMQGGWIGGGVLAGQATGAFIEAGVLNRAIGAAQVVSNPVLDGDLILVGGNFNFFGFGAQPIFAGRFYIDSGTSTFGGSIQMLSLQGQSIVWGPGSINVIGASRLTYAAGAGKAAATFTQTGSTKINGGTVACIGVPTATSIGACNTTISAANLDTNLGATSGCLFVPGGAAMCNSGI